MQKNYSTFVLPELLNKLRDGGLLTAITNLRSPRFTRYLKRPAQMMRDGWQLNADADPSEVVYTLGGHQGLHQELKVRKATKQVEVLTYCPRTGQSQSIVYCMRQKKVVSNSVKTAWEGTISQHHFISLPNSAGLLRRVEPPKEKVA